MYFFYSFYDSFEKMGSNFFDEVYFRIIPILGKKDECEGCITTNPFYSFPNKMFNFMIMVSFLF